MPTVTHHLLTLAQSNSLRWLLGLDKVDPTDPTAVLTWGHPLPSWAWVAIVAAVIAMAVLSYRHQLGRPLGRTLLTTARALLLLLIAVLLARPMILLPRETVEPDRVLMLVDRSASMSVHDVIAPPPAPQPPGSPVQPPTTPQPPRPQRISRDQQLRDLLAANAPLWQTLQKDHVLEWLGFSQTLMPLGDRAAAAELDEPTGRVTAMASAIGEAVRRATGKPISGIVLISDGRSSEALGSDTVTMLRQMGVEVFTVPLGSPDPPVDLSLQRIDIPDRAFVNDSVPVAVTISRTGPRTELIGVSGPADSTAPPGTFVKLIDKTTGQVLDQQPVTNLDAPVRLITTPKAAGSATWRVELVTSEPELIVDNNQQDLPIALLDRPIRLLLVEGYPRWEYRYLKNAITREASVESSIMLISADRTFAQEGTVPLRRLPRTAEEFKPYDVIIIGDVPAGFFSAQQMRLLQEQIARHGSGLLWIGGQFETPASYATSALSTLLPITVSQNPDTLSPPILMDPTPAATALGVLRLISPQTPAVTWPENLPPLFWAQSIDDLKPAAEPLAVDRSTGKPLIVRMRYGAGQTMYVATDETWRWRYGRGDLYGDQFWMQLIRLLARGRLQAGAGGDQRADLIVSRRRAATGDTVVVEMKINDQTLMQPAPQQIQVQIDQAPAPGQPASSPSSAASAASQTITLTATDEPGTYRATWSPQLPGPTRLNVTTPALADLGLTQTIDVERSDDELRYPATDHPLLADLAQRTGGTALAPADLPQLAQRLANRSRRTAADISEDLSHSPLALALLLTLLTAEWVGRRALGLA
jgi:uncharacterized membrane protein